VGTTIAGAAAGLFDAVGAVVVERDVPIQMRDGVILRADVHRPASGPPRPGIFFRTPYGKYRYSGPLQQAPYERYVRAGYVIVAQDTRGRYTSDGDYVPFSEEATQDGADGYDSVENRDGLRGARI
jgi:putative CocE/NonD family hydrolase